MSLAYTRIKIILEQLNEAVKSGYICDQTKVRAAELVSITGVTGYSTTRFDGVVKLISNVQNKLARYRVDGDTKDSVKRLTSLSKMCELIEEKIEEDALYDETKLLIICLADLLGRPTYPVNIPDIKELISIARTDVGFQNTQKQNTQKQDTQNTQSVTPAIRDLISKHINNINTLSRSIESIHFPIHVEIYALYTIARSIGAVYTRCTDDDPIYIKAGTIIAEMEIYISNI